MTNMIMLVWLVNLLDVYTGQGHACVTKCGHL